MLHQKPLIKNIEFSLRHRCQVQPGDRLLLAISGGADSTALLRAMKVIAQRPHWQLQLHAAHVNHHLRPEADTEATFVQQLCAEQQIPCKIRHIYPLEVKGNLEANARDLRYQALQEIAAQQNCSLIMTAHHADDQLETMLMRFIRGSGTAGLSGIRARRVLGPGSKLYLLRPLLNLEHRALIEFLNELGQNWCEDQSNQDTTRTRAKLRHEVIPLLKEIRDDASLKANSSAEQIQKADQLILKLTRKAEATLKTSDRVDSAIEYPRNSIRKIHPTVLDRLIRRATHQQGLSSDQLPARVMEQIITHLKSSSGESKLFELSGGLRIHITGDCVRVFKSK